MTSATILFPVSRQRDRCAPLRPLVDQPAAVRGFTLLEVLVTLVLLSILSVISWRALDSVQRGSERLDIALDDSQALGRVLGQLADDLAQRAGEETSLASRAASGASGTTGAAASPYAPQHMLQPSRPAARVAPHQPNTDPLPPGMHLSLTEDGQARLAITRRAAQTPSQWQRVLWYPQDGQLYRTMGPGSDQLPLPVPEQGEPVLNDVSRFDLQVWMPDQGWVPIPQIEAHTGQAEALRVTLERTHLGQPVTFHQIVLFQ